MWVTLGTSIFNFWIHLFTAKIARLIKNQDEEQRFRCSFFLSGAKTSFSITYRPIEDYFRGKKRKLKTRSPNIAEKPFLFKISRLRPQSQIEFLLRNVLKLLIIWLGTKLIKICTYVFEVFNLELQVQGNA